MICITCALCTSSHYWYQTVGIRQQKHKQVITEYVWLTMDSFGTGILLCTLCTLPLQFLVMLCASALWFNYFRCHRFLVFHFIPFCVCIFYVCWLISVCFINGGCCCLCHILLFFFFFYCELLGTLISFRINNADLEPDLLNVWGYLHSLLLLSEITSYSQYRCSNLFGSMSHFSKRKDIVKDYLKKCQC